MIELQGDLIKKTEAFDNQKLGDLEVRDGTPFLTIGIHELEGEFVTLKKPFVVLDPQQEEDETVTCLLYTSPSPRDVEESRMPSSA